MALPADDIRLALFRGSSAELVSVADLLAMSGGERGSADASPSWSTLSLIAGGEDRWGARLSLGALSVVVAQLEQAASHLDNGERAVLRGGVFDVPNVLLLLLEPDGAGGVVATLGATDDLPDPSWTADGPHGDELYAFVDEHRNRIVEAGRAWTVAPQRIRRTAAVDALRREAELGTAAVALLGPGSC